MLTIMFLIDNPASGSANIWKFTQGASSTHMMSNDDNLLVPVVDIVLAYRYTQGNVTYVSNVAGMGL